jgi:hypothetical protein
MKGGAERVHDRGERSPSRASARHAAILDRAARDEQAVDQVPARPHEAVASA